VRHSQAGSLLRNGLPGDDSADPRGPVSVPMKEELEKALQVLKERQAAAKGEPPANVSIVDPEAPWVKKSGRFVRGYSGQVVADSEHQVIVAVKATAQATDSEQLNPMLQEVERVAGRAADQLVADSGYYTDDAVPEASRGKTDCVIPDSETAAQLNNPKRNGSDQVAFHVSRFTYDEAKDEFICPQGKRLPFVRDSNRRGPTKVYPAPIATFVPFACGARTVRKDFAVFS